MVAWGAKIDKEMTSVNGAITRKIWFSNTVILPWSCLSVQPGKESFFSNHEFDLEDSFVCIPGHCEFLIKI
jgi:hypothetical protein